MLLDEIRSNREKSSKAALQTQGAFKNHQMGTLMSERICYISKNGKLEFIIDSDNTYDVVKIVSREEKSYLFVNREIKLDYTSLIEKNLHYGRFMGIHCEIEIETCNYQIAKIYIYIKLKHAM